MPAQVYKTLGELRSKLSARLGYGAAGAAAGVNATNLNSILYDSQVLLYNAHDWARMRRYTDVTVGANQYLIDYPEGCNPDRVKAISIDRGTSSLSPVWSPPLKKGISSSMYSTQGTTTTPYRWEPYEQIELFPKADRLYTVRVFYVHSLDRFTEDTDRASISDDDIFILSLGTAKAHYRQPDAKLHIDNATALLSHLKAKSWGKDVFSPYDYIVDDNPMVIPKVV